jgi:hypothetical protein
VRRWVWLLATAACSFERPADVGVAVGGQVRGLWNGSEAVALRLRVGDDEQVVEVATDQEFRFAREVGEGAAYEIIVDRQPARQVCVVANPTGTTGDQDLDAVEVHCRYATPIEIEVTPSAAEWTFDPLVTSHTVSTSLLMRTVEVSVSGEPSIAVRIGGADARSRTLELPLGETRVDVELSIEQLSRTYQLTLARGAPVTEVLDMKAPEVKAAAEYGYSVAVSGDTVAIGAPDDGAGAVYVYRRTAGTWAWEATLTASNGDNGDEFGIAVAIDGDTLVVGARGEDGPARGVHPSPAPPQNTAEDSGAAYLFTRRDGVWTETAYLKASNADVDDFFGQTVAVEGNTIVVGSREASAGRFHDPRPGDNNAAGAGAVYVFSRDVVTQPFVEQYLKAPNTDAGDDFGSAIALHGRLLAIGARNEDSAGGQEDDTRLSAGAVYVYELDGRWTFRSYIKADVPAAGAEFGIAVALSESYLAVGAPLRDGSRGAVYVYERAGALWEQKQMVLAPTPQAGAEFGHAISVGRDLLAVGAVAEDASGTSGTKTGAVHLFTRGSEAWTDAGRLIGPRARTGSQVGTSLSMSPELLVVGAAGDERNVSGIDPAETSDYSARRSGAASIFR